MWQALETESIPSTLSTLGSCLEIVILPPTLPTLPHTCLGELELQDVAVVDGEADQDAHQFEFQIHVQVRGPEPVEAGGLVVREHAVVGVEQLPHLF